MLLYLRLREIILLLRQKCLCKRRCLITFYLFVRMIFVVTKLAVWFWEVLVGFAIQTNIFYIGFLPVSCLRLFCRIN